MDPLELMRFMIGAGFPMGETLVSKGNGERGITVWFSDEAVEILADICYLAEWLDDKPVRPRK